MEVGDKMIHIRDPLQKSLFQEEIEQGTSVLSPPAARRVRKDWPGLFRTMILCLMPVGKLAKNFDPTFGCPTKELYAMAGAVFLKGFFNLTIDETVEQYLYNMQWHYALNLLPWEAGLGHATVERYEKLFAENDIAAEVFHKVTSKLIEVLELDVSRQRLDSTHVFSDMATFGRSKLMAVTIKRFLTQLKRHHRALYDALSEELRSRYAPSQAKLFADFSGGRQQLRQEVAEDLLSLVNQFGDDEAVTNRPSFQAMRRVLDEQCTVTEDKTAVEVKTNTGSDVMQNPSDPDATYDGHKGPGYQAQIAETCAAENDVQLITAVDSEPAHKSDQDAVEPMLDQLAAGDRLPETLHADGGYGRDENVVEAERRGVDLQSPVTDSPQQGSLTVDDFAIDEAAETVERCPNGCVPESSEHDVEKGRTRTVMSESDCSSCAFASQCPVQRVGGRRVLDHTPRQRRLAARRAEQATEVFQEHYRSRAGIESTNGGLKRRTGMGRLRTRGSPRVRMSILLRCGGWNVFRALAALKKRGIRDFEALAAAFRRLSHPFRLRQAPRLAPAALLATSPPIFTRFRQPRLSGAA